MKSFNVYRRCTQITHVNTCQYAFAFAKTIKWGGGVGIRLSRRLNQSCSHFYLYFLALSKCLLSSSSFVGTYFFVVLFHPHTYLGEVS